MEIKNAPEGARGMLQPHLDTNNFSTLEVQVQELIKAANSERPIRRKELARKLNIEDRTVRRTIEQLRCKGERILSGEKGGYFYAENEGQYRGWRTSITSRIVSMNKMVRAMDGRTEGQIYMEVQE